MGIESLEQRVLFSSGELQTGFGANGKLLPASLGLPADTVPLATVAQNDGKIVSLVYAGGSVRLMRLTGSGTLDGTFGVGGLTPALPLSTAPSAIIQSGAGDLVVAGGSIVARFNPEGSLDTTFAGDGTFDLSTYSHPYAQIDSGQWFSDIAELADGRLMAVGERTAVVLDNAGVPDDQFGFTSGVARLAPQRTGLSLVDVDVTASAVVLTGYTASGSTGGDLWVWKLTPTLTGPLPGFGDAYGRFQTKVLGSSLVVTDAEWLDDGSAVLLAELKSTPNQGFNLVRLRADGSIDGAFGRWHTQTPGVVPIRQRTNQNSDMYASALVVDPQARIYVSGVNRFTYGNTDLAVTRLLADGTPDFSFSQDGHARIDLGSNADSNFGMVLMPDGDVVLNEMASGTPTLLARVQGGGEASGILSVSNAGNNKVRLTFHFADAAVNAGFAPMSVVGYPVGDFDELSHATLYLQFDRKQVAGIHATLSDGNDAFGIARGMGPALSSIPMTILAGAGNDTISTADGNDSVDLGSGDDVIWSFAGNDTITGGDGNDNIDARTGKDSVTSGAGNDTVIATDGNDTLLGGDDHDTLTGGAGSRLYGGAGNDRLVLTGAGHVFGGAGDDSILGSPGADNLYGDEDADRIHAGDGNDRICAGWGRDTVFGQAGDDRIYGEQDPDRLSGDEGNDFIDGGHASDRLIGGAGIDHLVGGGGNNRYYTRDNTLDYITGRGFQFGDADALDRITGMILRS